MESTATVEMSATGGERKASSTHRIATVAHARLVSAKRSIVLSTYPNSYLGWYAYPRAPAAERIWLNCSHCS